MLFLITALWAAEPAEAEAPKIIDRPHLWVREFGAITVQPVGVIADVAVEARAPILRLGGLAFNTTFIGGGARIAASPAHLDTVARVTVQAIDLLPVTVEGFVSTYWDSPWGMVPMDQVPGQKMVDRQPLYDANKDFTGNAFGFSIKPTFQFKVGRFAAWTNVNFTWMKIQPRGGTEKWVYEPYRGLVVDYEDMIIDHTSGAIWEFSDGVGRHLLRIGPAVTGKTVRNTGDTTLMIGAMGQWRPGKNDVDPTVLLLIAPYLQDPDFLGPVPYVALAISSARLIPFRKLPNR